jgi:hypothetical protein
MSSSRIDGPNSVDFALKHSGELPARKHGEDENRQTGTFTGDQRPAFRERGALPSLRAAKSVCLYLAEGAGRVTRADKAELLLDVTSDGDGEGCLRPCGIGLVFVA